MGCEVVVSGARIHERRAIEELFAARDRTFSRFRPDSELSAVNARASATLVSHVFGAALAVALDAAAATDGLVDPTLGAAVVAAGYDRDFAGSQTPVPVALPRPVVAATSQSASPDACASAEGRTARPERRRQVAGRRRFSSPAFRRGFVSAGGDLASNEPVDVALPGAAPSAS